MSGVTKARRQEIDAFLAAGVKRCCRCGQVKSVRDFSPQPKDKTGLRPECMACRCADSRASYQNNHEARLQWQRAHRQGENYRCYQRDYQRERLRRERENRATRSRPTVCEVCGQPGSVFYDHDHSTGKRMGEFRGWLCKGCNSALGFVKDDAAVLRRLADYLEEYQRRKDRG